MYSSNVVLHDDNDAVTLLWQRCAQRVISASPPCAPGSVIVASHLQLASSAALAPLCCISESPQRA
jgi:hypothetical protein